MANLLGIRERLEVVGCGPPCPNDSDGRHLCDASGCKRILAVQKFLSKSKIYKQPVFNKAAYTKNFQGKDIVKSEAARQKGNSFFKKSAFKEALAHYNHAVRLAPFPRVDNNDTTLALAFGNRSAVLAHLNRHGETVRDVDWALEYGYPSESASKLVLRKVQALLHSKRPDLAAATLKAADDKLNIENVPEAVRAAIDNLKQEQQDKSNLLPELTFRYADLKEMMRRLEALVPGHDFQTSPAYVSPSLTLAGIDRPAGHPPCYKAARDIKAGYLLQIRFLCNR